MKNFDPFYNDLPKTETHTHLEGSIRTQTIIDVARQHNLALPTYEAAELDRHVKVYDQMRDPNNESFDNNIHVLTDVISKNLELKNEPKV